MINVLADFPTEEGRIKWSRNDFAQDGQEVQFAHLRVSNITITS
jgi:hypothetical protein